MQITPHLSIQPNELPQLKEQIDQKKQYYQSWRDRCDTIQNIALKVIAALVILNILYFCSPLLPLIAFSNYRGYYPLDSGLYYRHACDIASAIFRAKSLCIAGIANAIAAVILIPCYVGSTLAYKHYDQKVNHYAQLDGLITDKKAIPEIYHQELNDMVVQMRQKKPVKPQEIEISETIKNAKIPELNDEQQIDRLTEQAIHEIIPGLFLGGSDYSPKKIHRYKDESEKVVFDQIISATHWTTPEGFKPNADAEIYKFPGDPDRNPVDVTLKTFIAEDQGHLHKAIQIIDQALAKGKKVFVHCQQGKDRSATVVIAYIMSKHNVSFETAMTFVRSKRWIAEPGLEYQSFLKDQFRSVKLS